MSFEVYQVICRLLMTSGTTESIFTHCFLVLEWNLMARSDNVCTTHINHISWDDNSLIFYFLKSKKYREGGNSNEPWYLYANPFNPFICPIVALTRFVFCNPSVLNGTCKLFESTDPYQLYSKVLCRVLEANESTYVFKIWISSYSFDFTGTQEEHTQSKQYSIDKTIKQLIVGGMNLAPKAYT